VGGDDSCEDEDESMGSDGYEADEQEHDADELSRLNNYNCLAFVSFFCSVIPRYAMDFQDDAERREAASVGLLSLMDAPPPAAGPAGYLLNAEAEAKEAQQIAARWDERARQNAKFTYEIHDGEDILNQMALAPTVHDDPMWRVRVRVSDHKFYSICH
jgi:hypothetical protein